MTFISFFKLRHKFCPWIFQTISPQFISSYSTKATSIPFQRKTTTSDSTTTNNRPPVTRPTNRLPPIGGSILVGPLTHVDYDIGRYIVTLKGNNLKFQSGKELVDYYLNILAQILGSEEAKQRIYFISAEWYRLSFGARIDYETSLKLQALPDVGFVACDFFSEARENSPLAAKSTSEFVPVNWKGRLFNLDEYFLFPCNKEGCLSESNRVGDPGQWIISIKPDTTTTAYNFVDYYVNLLSQFMENVQEAREKIYIIWDIYPIGFAAEMSAVTANNLKGLPNVEKVLPDYDCIAKNKDAGTIMVSPPLHKGSGPYLYYMDLTYDEDEEESLQTTPFSDELMRPYFLPQKYIDGLGVPSVS